MEPTPQPTNSNDVRVLREITSSWRESLAELDRADDDQVIAGHMVGALLQVDYRVETLEALDPLVMDVFDLVGQLETPLVPGADRPWLWAETKKGVAQLERKYLKGDRPHGYLSVNRAP